MQTHVLSFDVSYSHSDFGLWVVFCQSLLWLLLLSYFQLLFPFGGLFGCAYWLNCYTLSSLTCHCSPNEAAFCFCYHCLCCCLGNLKDWINCSWIDGRCWCCGVMFIFLCCSSWNYMLPDEGPSRISPSAWCGVRYRTFPRTSSKPFYLFLSSLPALKLAAEFRRKLEPCTARGRMTSSLSPSLRLYCSVAATSVAPILKPLVSEDVELQTPIRNVSATSWWQNSQPGTDQHLLSRQHNSVTLLSPAQQKDCWHECSGQTPSSPLQPHPLQ